MKMKGTIKKTWRWALAATVLFVLGCTEEPPGDGTPLGKLAAEETVLVVDGTPLTKAALLARVGTIEALRRHRQPDRSGQDAAAQRQALCRAYLPVFIDQTLLANWARTEGVTASASLTTNYMRRAFRNLRARTDKTFDDLLAVPGVDAAQLRDQIRGEALRQAIEDALVARSPTNLPPEAIQRELADMRAYNAVMAQTNTLIYARATNVWNQLKAGGDFKALARSYTEIPDEVAEDGAWGMIDDSFLRDDPALLAALKNLKPGEFTPPVEGDNGLMIARLDARDEDGSYAVSRIFFRLPLMIDYPTAEELVATAKAAHAKNLFDDLVRRLRATAKVTYPHGKDLFTRRMSTTPSKKDTTPSKKKENP